MTIVITVVLQLRLALWSQQIKLVCDRGWDFVQEVSRLGRGSAGVVRGPFWLRHRLDILCGSGFQGVEDKLRESRESRELRMSRSIEGGRG